MRVIIASSLAPISCISGPAASSASRVSRITTVIAREHDRALRPGRRRAPTSSMTRRSSPGPAIIGIAIGKTRDVLGLGRALDLLGALLAPLGAPLEHHVERDHEQHDAAGDAEAGEADAERPEQRLAEQARRTSGCTRRSSDERIAIARRCAGVGAAGQRGEDRRAARRVDDHQEGDEGRGEQLDHSARGTSLFEHLLVARAVPQEDAEAAGAVASSTFQSQPKRAVGGLAAAVVLGRRARLLRRSAAAAR